MENTTEVAASEAGKSSYSKVFSNMLASLERHEQKIRDDVISISAPDNPAIKLPDHIKDLFKRLDANTTSTADRKLVNTLKRSITEIHANRTDYLLEQVQTKSERVRLELAVRAISKTTSGIQQLLSAQ